jgi:fermentation-respiration switch protein FrsA (DUF1100 family)
VSRRDIEFQAEGTTLRGWLYEPDGGAGERAPVIVVAPEFAAVKEMGLARFADMFAAAGLAVLVFDHRNFGASDGSPRQEFDPWAQIRDYRHAVTWLRTLPDIDPGRIGLWGSGAGAWHAIVAGAIDRRVGAIVAQAPLECGWRSLLRLVRSDLLAEMREQFEVDRRARYHGAAPAMIPVVTEDRSAEPCALPARDTWAWFTEAGAQAPAWRNQVTLRSVEMLTEYEPGPYLARVSPTALCMVVAADDDLTPVDVAAASFETASEPKRLLVLPGGHFAAYGDAFGEAAKAACDWFVEHLSESAASGRGASRPGAPEATASRNWPTG